MAIAFYILFFKNLLHCADLVFFELREKQLDEMVQLIQSSDTKNMLYDKDLTLKADIDEQQRELNSRLGKLDLIAFKIVNDTTIRFWIHRDHGLEYKRFPTDSLRASKIDLYENQERLNDNWHLWYND